MEDKFKLFMDVWGEKAQIMMCVEEMSELTKALCKYKRFNKEQSSPEIKQNILEEIADVLNTAEQMKYYFGEEEVEKIRREKIERALKKIK